MIIAIAGNNLEVSQHFGHCEAFYLFEIEGRKLIQSQVVPNPGHKPGYLPVFLHEHGVNIIVSGGMGAGAVEIFNSYNIDVITGATGTVEATIQKYINGQLQSTNSVCEDHMHIH
ncbi:MAG: dinitrogenase iron-molybdenum cofactor [Tenericutes bacterium HGW-Tenericutes-1]|jgi:predicted Fe-Mo cluster-binding NifX family protein|nr:MAG: dinitrogenase iron-molybdenum cofactor [Tenericutes bacterium HGW-Tenericutes-1]